MVMEHGPSLVLGGQFIALGRGTNILGRRDRESGFNPDVDLTDYDPGLSVSRRHAEVSFREGHPLLRDLDSTNGSTISGVSLQRGVFYPLRDRDALGFGDVQAEFRLSLTLPDTPPPLQSPSITDGVDASLAQPGYLGVGFCDRCGHQREPGARFCGLCGNPLG